MSETIFRLSAFADEAAPRLADQLAALRAHGIARIELRGVDGKNCLDLTDEAAREVRRALDGEGVRLSALGSPLGKTPIRGDWSEVLDATRRALDLCALLGADRVRMFSFFVPKGEDAGAYRDEVLERLSRMADEAVKFGVRLMHENEKGIYGDTDARCLDILSSLDGRIGCIFDPANFVQCGVRPLAALQTLDGRVEAMHIKDALFQDGSVVPAGAGDGDVRKALENLLPRARDMLLTLEPHLAVFDGLNALQSEALRGVYAYPDAETAFSAAVGALKELLKSLTLREGEEKCTWIR